MATVKGPLFSLGASGTLAGAIVFSTWKGRPYVREHVVPANPKSQAQLGVRQMLKFLSQYWDSLTPGEQADWEEPAAVTNISPFNAFIAYNQSAWAQFLSPSIAYPATRADTAGTITFDSVDALVRSLLITVTVTVLADNWGVLIFRDLTTAFTPSRNNAVAAIPALSAAAFTWLDVPLPAGVEQFYRLASFSEAGDMNVLVTEMSGTPTA